MTIIKKRCEVNSMNQAASNPKCLQDLVNYNFYAEAQATWNVNNLILEVEKIRNQYLPMGEGLSKFHKQYLLMVLVGKQLPDMVPELEDISSVDSLRTKLSNDKKKKGIHFCLEKLLKQEIGNPQNIIFHLFNSKYRKQPQPPNFEKERNLLIRIPDDVSAKQLLEIESKVRAITGCPYIRVVEIKMGSIILHLKGSQSACEQVESLHQQGLLADRLGVPIIDVEIIPSRVNLIQWFDNILTTGWQAANELLSPSRLVFRSRDEIQGTKLIDLRSDLSSHSVVLLVNLLPENDDSFRVEITLRVYPTGDDVYLPPNFKLIVLSENEVFQEITARSEDRIIQCQFSGEVGEEFTVQLVLGEAVITEDFVI
ncbi:MAG: DUF1822 family protein [Okeania sp. SIO2F4]|uniref:DUF1822 family protein n=1 Tax=Okeania sp. SIO2F4 TaxID=2607790 RepID=UPI00142B2ACD|nr:DUF1822 family protein [Okeania sp. SIO2F4]NES04841.1 DUF1822 family protein [Okeania sp. SIO2F4]